jgi:hypothetical protein
MRWMSLPYDDVLNQLLDHTPQVKIAINTITDREVLYHQEEFSAGWNI